VGFGATLVGLGAGVAVRCRTEVGLGVTATGEAGAAVTVTFAGDAGAAVTVAVTFGGDAGAAVTVAGGATTVGDTAGSAVSEVVGSGAAVGDVVGAGAGVESSAKAAAVTPPMATTAMAPAATVRARVGLRIESSRTVEGALSLVRTRETRSGWPFGCDPQHTRQSATN
jgi:hypothetical protein